MNALVHEQGFFFVPKKALIVSVVLHLCLPLVYLILQLLEGSGVRVLPLKKVDVKKTQEFIQVDVVALPDQMIGDLKNVDTSLPIVKNPANPIPTAQPSTAKPDDLVLSKEKAAKKAKIKAKARAKRLQKIKEEQKKKEIALKRSKALSKLKAQAEREAAIKELAKNAKQGRAAIAGNIESKGTSTRGQIGTSKDQYVARLAQAIKNNFNVFPWQKKKELMNVVYLEVTPRGKIRNSRLKVKSGDPLYDAAVLKAVRATKSLPVPEDLSIIADGIEVEFRP